MAAQLCLSQEAGDKVITPDGREPCARWLSGVPGTPGFDGIPGRDGREGREGEKGNDGEPGSRGLKGIPGELGVEGPTGHPGFPGNPGLKGEKGESYFTYHSAFSVGLTEEISIPDTPIRFNKAFYNEQHDYDEISGKFRCVIPGIYFFTYHLTVHGKQTQVALYRNGRTVAFTLDQFHNGDLDQASGGTILNLASGDEVWLQVYSGGEEEFIGGVYADITSDSTFSGFLLSPKLQNNPLDNRRR
ncbi:adiponectin [Chanos chanos]|uniref:Adiponectin n=1 Tax=Chanos chanos TaxID=29144 RepID=A0A6J2UUL0_CHACN|nr:adiponectin-like [Chanos chanos]